METVCAVSAAIAPSRRGPVSRRPAPSILRSPAPAAATHSGPQLLRGESKGWAGSVRRILCYGSTWVRERALKPARRRSRAGVGGSGPGSGDLAGGAEPRGRENGEARLGASRPGCTRLDPKSGGWGCGKPSCRRLEPEAEGWEGRAGGTLG